MSYSKGAWRVEGPFSNGNALRIFAETEYLATVGGSDQTTESIAENARLIAAAPAMYEALKRAKMLGIHEEFIDAAIQQAEGGNSEPLGPLG